jgi:carboxypeptidase C (cathepsin A)
VENCSFNDITDAAYNYKFVQGWLDKFPEYENHTLYLAGESYAGVYVPLLAWRIVDGNRGRQTKNPVNLAGFLVGNGCTNWNYDTFPATVDIAYNRALYSQELRQKIVDDKCNFTGVAFQTLPQPPICDQYMA